MSMASEDLVIGLRGTYSIETRHGERAFGIKPSFSESEGAHHLHGQHPIELRR